MSNMLQRDRSAIAVESDAVHLWLKRRINSEPPLKN